MTDRRHNTHPALETLCRQYGGISQVPAEVAFFELDQAAWDVYFRRITPIIADRMSDKTPVVATIRIPGGCYVVD